MKANDVVGAFVYYRFVLTLGFLSIFSTGLRSPDLFNLHIIS